MKIDEIKIGKAYVIQHRGIGIVVDIGKLSECSSGSGTTRTLEWNGGSFPFLNWYRKDDTVATRRVALVQLDRTLGRLIVVTAAQLMFEPQEDSLKEDVVKHLTTNTVKDVKKRWEDNKGVFDNQIRTLVRTLTPDVTHVHYSLTDNPFGRLLASDALPKMVLLYLQYHHSRGESLNGYDDVEALMDSFRESVAGLRALNAAPPSKDIADVDVAARSHLDSVWSSSGCVPNILTQTNP